MANYEAKLASDIKATAEREIDLLLRHGLLEKLSRESYRPFRDTFSAQRKSKKKLWFEDKKKLWAISLKVRVARSTQRLFNLYLTSPKKAHRY